MRSPVKVLAGVVAIAALVVAVGALVGWWGGHTPDSEVAKATPPTLVETDTDSSYATNFTSRSHTTEPRAVVPAPATDASAPTAVATTATGAAMSWDDKLDEILGADTDDKVKVQQLLALFPSMPPDMQGVAARHLTNLVGDDDYAPLGKMLADPKTEPQVLDVLIGDVLNRPNPVKLPLLLQVASAPDHPKAGEAKDLLELYLGDDYGSDWQKWQDKMTEWLKDNPG